MAWILRLVKTEAEGERPCMDVMEINRPGDLVDIANLGLIPDALSADCCGPGAMGDGGQALRRAHQLVPSVAAGIHDGTVAIPDVGAEKVGAQISPDLFYRVQFRCVGRQRKQADVLRSYAGEWVMAE